MQFSAIVCSVYSVWLLTKKWDFIPKSAIAYVLSVITILWPFTPRFQKRFNITSMQPGSILPCIYNIMRLKWRREGEMILFYAFCVLYVLSTATIMLVAASYVISDQGRNNLMLISQYAECHCCTLPLLYRLVIVQAMVFAYCDFIAQQFCYL